MPDNMTPEQRRLTMSRIQKSNTKPEITVRRLVFARGLRFRKYVSSLPGTPDLVFSGARVAVFVDGDFWHGWRLDEWEHKLSSTYWKEKIARNRKRDSEHDAKLKEDGWTVIRVWEHEVEKDPEACVRRIEAAVRAGRQQHAADGASRRR
jgi:DNA mismatch endonuclease (patch repair protein)